MTKSLMKIHHPTSVRSLVFSPCLSNPLQAVVGLDNGSIYRWDLKMGQRGQLDRLPVAHAGPILALDWCSTSSTSNIGDEVGADRSWIVSGGLDHTVKARWFLTPTAQYFLTVCRFGTSSHLTHLSIFRTNLRIPCIRQSLCAEYSGVRSSPPRSQSFPMRTLAVGVAQSYWQALDYRPPHHHSSMPLLLS
jgi:WD repeat-containing protein 24